MREATGASMITGMSMAAEILTENKNLFSKEEIRLIDMLCENNNSHLFEGWDELGTNDEKKKSFVAALLHADASYSGGLESYITNAQKLLAQSKVDFNPFEGFIPEQPDIVDVTELDNAYCEYEKITEQNLDKIGFVMVAGGLGERLGYNGIKIDIPFEGITSQTYLQYYCESIGAMQKRAPESTVIPFVIMTSQDTNEKTVKSLEANNYFGLAQEQIHVLKQELVPAISSNAGAIATDSTYDLALKPHGHGDIHMLIHTSGLGKKLHAEGKEYLMFIQDTNGQVMNFAPALLGVSIKNKFDYNSTAVNRIPGEAVGGLTKLVRGDEVLTLNVEYNQLDPLLRATVSPEGDVPNEKGFSMFPGNTNTLVIRLETYVKILEESKGIIAEFVNPKYADAAKEQFKKPTRLETMMQDYPKLLDASYKVGVSLFARDWCFSANKNNFVDAKVKYESGGVPESASTAESDYYLGCYTRLAQSGMNIEPAKDTFFLGLPFKGPQAVVKPSFAISLSEVKKKVTGGSLAAHATLVLDGSGIRLHNVSVASGAALIIKAVDGAEVNIFDLNVVNDGFEQVALSDVEMQSSDIPEHIKIRGYTFQDRGALEYSITEPGKYSIGADGILTKI